MRPNTAVHAGEHFIEHSAVASDQVVDGHPRTGLATLGRFGGLELAQGAETVWTVTETLRKVYLV